MSLEQTRPAAILWDLDGTLADTHPLIYKCVDLAFREHFARNFDHALWAECVGHPLTFVLDRGFREYGIACDDMAPVIGTYRQLLRENESEVRAFPAACDTVRSLKLRGFRQAVVTTKFGEACTRHLGTLGLADTFEVVVSGDHCTRHKPDPEPFCRALTLLRLGPEACIMVGDSAVDIIGSRAAGIRSITALWGTLDHKAVEAARPDYWVDRPEQIVALLEGWKA